MMRRLRRLLKLAALGLTVAAISQEMSKPESERTWTGRVLGLVPYDFRPPTWDRIREAYWNADDERLFTDRVFGVGWAVNLYRAKSFLSGLFGGLMGGRELPSPVRRYASSVQDKAGRVAERAGEVSQTGQSG
ncbi:MAG: DUF5808 domain-containing protein [Candidatus Dormibacterales bacterium]